MVVNTMEEIREASTPCRSIPNGSGIEPSPVQLDHCYAKPWNWRQEMAHCKPVRVLFAEEHHHLSSGDEMIDVEDFAPPNNVSILDKDITTKNFIDAEQKLNQLTTEENSVDWEESVKRDGWTPLQHRIFNKVVKLLIADNMARLATEKLENEAIQKKLNVEGSAKKLRIILSSVAWDVKIIQWLHLTLIEHLNRDYLLCYINILQLLQNRIPNLIERILNTPLTNTKLVGLNNQILNYLSGKPWEPALNPSNSAITKLPVVPFIVMVPSGMNSCNATTSVNSSRRFQTWHNLFQTLGRVTTVSPQTAAPPNTLPLPVLVESIINATVSKIQELKAGCPNRPIILAGIQQGALIAAQAAYLEPVTALVCLGFPLFCVDGKRGEPDDFILDIKSPTMFVIGQSCSTCTVDGMEQLRHRMKAESSLVVVDGAVDSLRMLRWKRKLQNVTQSVVDACVLEEISTFVTSVLTQAHAQQASGKKSPVERKADGTPGSVGQQKRQRHSLDPDDSALSALSGHNYSQSTPFAQPWKGRSGTGLARVRGGRTGPGHARLPYHRGASDISPPIPKGRIGRSLSNRSLSSMNDNSGGEMLSRTNSSNQLDNMDIDCKSSICSSQGSPKEEANHPPVIKCKGGGDSSETESAPPADDDDEIMEDLRFCHEFKNKQHNQTLQKHDDSGAHDDDFSLKFSGDEGDDIPLADVCRRLSAENRNRIQNNRNPADASPE